MNARALLVVMKLAATQKGLGGVKPLMPASFIWMIADLSIRLAVLIVSTIKRLKGN